MLKKSLKTIKIILLLIILLNTCFFINPQKKKRVLKGQDPKTNLMLEFLLGYGFPVNSSYIDTYENTDIYWNPHSGITADLRLTVKLHEFVYLALPIDISFGIYQYTTTDGRKIGTEAAAGHEPITTNTE